MTDQWMVVMSTQLIGFSIGGIARRFLVQPPSMSTVNFIYQPSQNSHLLRTNSLANTTCDLRTLQYLARTNVCGCW